MFMPMSRKKNRANGGTDEQGGNPSERTSGTTSG